MHQLKVEFIFPSGSVFTETDNSDLSFAAVIARHGSTNEIIWNNQFQFQLQVKMSGTNADTVNQSISPYLLDKSPTSPCLP